MRRHTLANGYGTVLDMGAERRGSYIMQYRPVGENDGSPRMVVLAEPPPDAAMNQLSAWAADVQAEISEVDTSAAGGGLDAKQIVDLTNRTQAIVVLRDGLFRLAESRANGFIDDTQWCEKFDRVMAQALEIAKLGQQEGRAYAAAQSVISEMKATSEEAKTLLQQIRAAKADDKTRSTLVLPANTGEPSASRPSAGNGAGGSAAPAGAGGAGTQQPDALLPSPAGSGATSDAHR